MIKENAPSVYEQTDVMEQIKGPVGQNDFSVMNFVIPLRAKYKKEALDFCLYLTNEQNQQLKQKRNQKEINTLVNTAVQSTLLNKDSTESVLSKLQKDLEALAE